MDTPISRSFSDDLYIYVINITIYTIQRLLNSISAIPIQIQILPITTNIIYTIVPYYPVSSPLIF